MFDRIHDARVRTAAFDWLTTQVAARGDVLPREVLAHGFELDGVRIPMIGPQGIFKPRVLVEVPLSITTAPHGPYDDSFGDDRLLLYRYRGTDVHHADNRGLRRAMELGLPLAYFHGVMAGKYVATWPVFVVRDDPSALAFSVVVDDAEHSGLHGAAPEGEAVREDEETGRRLYITQSVRRRLHQRAFRERVLEAYRRQCSFCRLRHAELLDAAHIVADSEPEGEPVIQNGIALCKLHHAAFDQHFVGLRPDLILQVRRDLLEEEDGPTLEHAIQSLHGCRITVPRRPSLNPASELVERRYATFLQAACSGSAS